MKIEWGMYNLNGKWHASLNVKALSLHIDYPMHEHWISDAVLNWLQGVERSRGKIEGMQRIKDDIRWWETGEE